MNELEREIEQLRKERYAAHVTAAILRDKFVRKNSRGEELFLPGALEAAKTLLQQTKPYGKPEAKHSQET